MPSCLNPRVLQRMTHTQLEIQAIRFKKEKKEVKGKIINKRKKEKVKKQIVLMGKNITLPHHNLVVGHGLSITNILESKAFDIYAHEIQ